jgi:hypothetical protein
MNKRTRREEESEEFFGIYRFIAHEHSVAELIFHIIKRVGVGCSGAPSARRREETVLTMTMMDNDVASPTRCYADEGMRLCIEHGMNER